MSSPPSGLWCRTLQNTKDPVRIVERNFRRPTTPVTTRKLSRFLLTPITSRAFETRVQREETLFGVVLALQRTIVGKNVPTGWPPLSPPLRETGKTIKGRRGAVSPCMIMRCNLRHKRNDTVKEEEDYTARWGWAGGMHETGLFRYAMREEDGEKGGWGGECG